jgi:hypothetical protein
MLEIRLGYPERVAAMAATLEQLAAQHSIVQAEGSRLLLGGWALAHLGDPETGYARILEGHAILQRIGMIAGSTQILCYATEAIMLAGRWSVAQAQVDEALQLAQRLGERVRIPDLLLLQARIALAQGCLDSGRASLGASLDEARAQQALGFELEALVALCRLDQPEPADLDRLEDAYGRLEEGFETALAVKARELLASHRRAPRAG